MTSQLASVMPTQPLPLLPPSHGAAPVRYSDINSFRNNKLSCWWNYQISIFLTLLPRVSFKCFPCSLGLLWVSFSFFLCSVGRQWEGSGRCWCRCHGDSWLPWPVWGCHSSFSWQTHLPPRASPTPPGSAQHKPSNFQSRCSPATRHDVEGPILPGLCQVGHG